MVAEMKRRHANLYHQVSREPFDQAARRARRANPAAAAPRNHRRHDAPRGAGRRRPHPRRAAQGQGVRLPLAAAADCICSTTACSSGRWRLATNACSARGSKRSAACRPPRRCAACPRSPAGKTPWGQSSMRPSISACPTSSRRSAWRAAATAAELTLSKAGRHWVERVPVGEVAAVWPPDTDASFINPDGWLDARGPVPQPLWLQAPLDYHRLIELPAQRAIYAQLNWVTDLEKQSPGAIRRPHPRRAPPRPIRTAVILDVRLNYGGNGGLRNPLINRLIKLEDEDTRLFVLTARGSFSATQFILGDLDRLSRGDLRRRAGLVEPVGLWRRLSLDHAEQRDHRPDVDQILAGRPGFPAVDAGRHRRAADLRGLCGRPRSGARGGARLPAAPVDQRATARCGQEPSAIPSRSPRDGRRIRSTATPTPSRR